MNRHERVLLRETINDCRAPRIRDPAKQSKKPSPTSDVCSNSASPAERAAVFVHTVSEQLCQLP